MREWEKGGGEEETEEEEEEKEKEETTYRGNTNHCGERFLFVLEMFSLCSPGKPRTPISKMFKY